MSTDEEGQQEMQQMLQMLAQMAVINYPNAAPIAKGDRIKKVEEDPEGDVSPIGAVGTVIGALDARELGPLLDGLGESAKKTDFVYLVQWDGLGPEYAAFTADWKVAAAEEAVA